MLEKCILLKDNFDSKKLLADYEIAKKTRFTKRTYIKGSSVSLYRDTIGWHSIPLHSVDGNEGNEGNILRNIDYVNFKSTPTLHKCKYFQEILDDLDTDIYLVRLMKLDANGYIAPHSDAPQFQNILEIIRCCIPIITNDKVDFYIDGDKYNLKENILWYTDVTKEHWVRNNSSEDRIHLVIDFKPTIEIMNKIGLTKLLFFKKFYFKDNILENKQIKFERINENKYKKSKYCIIMCQWKRFHTLNNILSSFENQDIKVDLYIWNNNYDDKDNLIKILKSRNDYKINIYLYNSPYNIKCIGRIITAYLIKYLYNKIIFFDDDQIMISNNVVKKFVDESNKYPNSIISWWAHNIKSHKHFYDRINMQNCNIVVNYGGGGGCIIPPLLFSSNFMEWLPYKYFNVEDFLCNIYIYYFMKGCIRSLKVNIKFIGNESVSIDSMSYGYKICERSGIEIHELKDLCLQWAIKKYNYPIYNENISKELSNIKILNKNNINDNLNYKKISYKNLENKELNNNSNYKKIINNSNYKV